MKKNLGRIMYKTLTYWAQTPSWLNKFKVPSNKITHLTFHNYEQTESKKEKRRIGKWNNYLG